MFVAYNEGLLEELRSLALSSTDAHRSTNEQSSASSMSVTPSRTESLLNQAGNMRQDFKHQYDYNSNDDNSYYETSTWDQRHQHRKIPFRERSVSSCTTNQRKTLKRFPRIDRVVNLRNQRLMLTQQHLEHDGNDVHNSNTDNLSMSDGTKDILMDKKTLEPSRSSICLLNNTAVQSGYENVAKSHSLSGFSFSSEYRSSKSIEDVDPALSIEGRIRSQPVSPEPAIEFSGVAIMWESDDSDNSIEKNADSDFTNAEFSRRTGKSSFSVRMDKNCLANYCNVSSPLRDMDDENIIDGNNLPAHVLTDVVNCQRDSSVCSRIDDLRDPTVLLISKLMNPWACQVPSISRPYSDITMKNGILPWFFKNERYDISHNIAITKIQAYWRGRNARHYVNLLRYNRLADKHARLSLLRRTFMTFRIHGEMVKRWRRRIRVLDVLYAERMPWYTGNRFNARDVFSREGKMVMAREWRIWRLRAVAFTLWQLYTANYHRSVHGPK